MSRDFIVDTVKTIVHGRWVRTDDAGRRVIKKPKGPNAEWVDPKTLGLTQRSTRDRDVAALDAVQASRPAKPPGRR